VYWGGRNPTRNRFKGNIITAKTGKLLELPARTKIKGKNEISENICWPTGNAQVGGLTDAMATRIDPRLTEGDDGIYQLQSGSPACGKIQGTPFSSLTDVDIYGVNRSRNTDAGCHQYSTVSTRLKKRITTADVGPKVPTPFDDSPVWNPPILGMQRKSKRKSTSRMQRK
jgi:hypothetical protein